MVKKTMTMAAILVAAATANADEYQVVHQAAPTPIGEMKPCDAIKALGDLPTEGAKCKKVASKKMSGGGTAVLYALGGPKDGFVRYAIVLDGKKVSPPVDLMSDDAMGGKHVELGKSTPKLRAVTVNGQGAVALDLVTKFTYSVSDVDSGKTVENHPYKRYDYLVCNGDACLVAGFGGNYESCHASLSNDGILTHACDQDTELQFK